MDVNETKQFLAQHKRLHPDFAKWANQLDEDSTRAIFDVWCLSLSDVSLEDASGVSRALLDGTVEAPEGWSYGRDYNALGGFIRKHAKRREKATFKLSGSCNRTGKELTYHCRHCRDTGYREVYHPNSIALVVDGALDLGKDSRRLHVCSMLCDCEAGRGILGAQPDKWKESQLFDPNEWCECPNGDVVAHASDLKSWIDARQDVRNHRNYNDDLAAYNEA